MKVERIIVFCALMLVVAVALTLKAFDSHGSRSQPLANTFAGGAKTPASRMDLQEDYKGFAITLHKAAPAHPYEQVIDELADTGANSVLIVPIGLQENASSASIFIDVRKSPPPARISQIIRHARDKGLKVMLMPIILLDNPRVGEWRGKIRPDNPDGWWTSYADYILHYARLGEQAGADVLIIGSELVLMENQTDRWRSLIAQVRKVFTGRLSYSANWDHFRSVGFWDDLDMIGMTTYHDLSGSDETTFKTIMEAWKPIKQGILTWQATVQRPILFTEVGWPNQATCAKYPWDYTRSPNKPDPKLQAECFRAFFETWNAQTAVAGTIIWEWKYDPGQNPGDPTSQDYTGYIPAGKPAMDVIVEHFRQMDNAVRTTN